MQPLQRNHSVVSSLVWFKRPKGFNSQPLSYYWAGEWQLPHRASTEGQNLRKGWETAGVGAGVTLVI